MSSAATYTTFHEGIHSPDVKASTKILSPTTNLAPKTLPYWLVNVPRSQWTAECPSYLRDTSQKNIEVLSTPDEQYRRQGWELVKEIVRSNQIDRFQRLPSDLRRYLEYKEQIVAEYGSVMRFVVKERLRWGEGTADDLKPKGRPFEYDEDIRILYNDWPYGVEEGIVHLVVWTKFELEDDPVTDDLTPRARQEIEEYVQRTFLSRMPADQVIWFKNWKSLKSVHAVEHFHVMLHHPDAEFLREITGGDAPLKRQSA
ncbi:GIG1 family protein [Aspergillus luchuensis]|uniref:Uncharacterized protein n=1 Tax=Aspergillus kawachii TaxID=1069201 RepID=A0A7R7W0Z0_ASPKA|nr:uncharacterized protein AKAW2_11437S [Aspergillus luchuensis]BCR94391.1 hypothetical protein AKAW2_11437S [Aspergillus luchuensis]BCS06992.1 hypothetical protein ALUC_11373S [Aspergillus luchuensis]GAA85463.1 similar to An07g08350 [Aspergillus luchuensis IFO 4308]